MKRNTVSAALVATFAVLSLAAFSPFLLANSHQGCSNRSVAGTYAYTVTGTRIGVGVAASVGLVTLDKDGTLTGSQTASFNGLILTETLTGTFSVGDDCTGPAVIDVVSSNPAFNRTSHLTVEWDLGAEQMRFIFTDANTILTGEGRPVH